MKLKKLIRFILIIIILILLFTIIRSTYSKYVTAFEKSTGAVLNAWNIKINDEKITTDANFTNTLKVNFDTNPHIATNTLAPTRTGTILLILDSTGTQVPYEYKIEIVDGTVDYDSTAIPDYRIYAYSLNGGETVILDDTITEISGIVQPATDINTVVKNEISLYVEWYDGPDNIMDNAEDVIVTQSGYPYGTVPIGVFVTQVYQ